MIPIRLFSVTTTDLPSRARDPPSEGASRPAGAESRRAVEVRILPHLKLYFLAIFFVIHQQPALAVVAALDLGLGPREQSRQRVKRAGRIGAQSSVIVRLFGSQTGQQNVVVQRQVLPM